MRRFRLAAALAAALAGFGGTATSALATGGATIASAPAVSYGSQQFGNTASDSPSSDNLCGGSEQNSWWQLPVLAGDRVTIDFEQPGALVETVYPVGTSDFSVANTNYSQRAELQSNGAGQGTLTASRDGTMPLDFSTYDCDFGSFGTPGPYDFTAYVAHQLVLFLTSSGSSRRTHTSSFALQLHRPDGAVVADPSIRGTVQLRSGGRWANVATVGAPYRFSVHWGRRARGKLQSVRVQVTTGGYQSATSHTIRVKAV